MTRNHQKINWRTRKTLLLALCLFSKHNLLLLCSFLVKNIIHTLKNLTTHITKNSSQKSNLRWQQRRTQRRRPLAWHRQLQGEYFKSSVKKAQNQKNVFWQVSKRWTIFFESETDMVKIGCSDINGPFSRKHEIACSPSD